MIQKLMKSVAKTQNLDIQENNPDGSYLLTDVNNKNFSVSG